MFKIALKKLEIFIVFIEKIVNMIYYQLSDMRFKAGHYQDKINISKKNANIVSFDFDPNAANVSQLIFSNSSPTDWMKLLFFCILELLNFGLSLVL